MTWTYTSNPHAKQLDEIRVLCGDIDEAQPLVDDEILLYFLAIQGTVKKAAIEACRFILHRLSLMGKGRVEGLEWDYTSIVTATQQYLTNLQTSANGGYVYAGGLSYAEKEAELDNTDLIPVRFKRNLHNSY